MFNHLTNHIVRTGAPIILPDTCILLDILRSPRRKSIDARSAASAAAISDAVAGTGQVFSVIAQQVYEELHEHWTKVRDETTSDLNKMQSELDRLDDWSEALGNPGVTSIAHGLSGVARCDLILANWVDASARVETTDELTGRAHRRMMQSITPARPGKDSFKDCLVVETYLSFAESLRDAGFAAPIIFASSNTEEFIVRPSKKIKEDINIDFDRVQIVYSRALHETAYRLGLKY